MHVSYSLWSVLVRHVTELNNREQQKKKKDYIFSWKIICPSSVQYPSNNDNK